MEMKFPEATWTPLASKLPVKMCYRFMYMGQAVQDSLAIHLYKHQYTREYINIDDAGNCYGFNGESYFPINDRLAISPFENFEDEKEKWGLEPGE
jgi:hypothetical protein